MSFEALGEVADVVRRALVCEVATFSRDGVPLTYPQTPYLAGDGSTIDVSTGVTYPAKAERARRNPHVGMLFSTFEGTGLERPPVVLVLGMAAVRDRDLQANTDRYVRESMAKLPHLYRQVPARLLQRFDWYWTRIWVLVTPIHVYWWPHGDLDTTPHHWAAPEATRPLASDPRPNGKPLLHHLAPSDWRGAVERALPLGPPVLSVGDLNGFPVPLRMRGATATPDGFRLEVPRGVPVSVSGPACLTFHDSSEGFRALENVAFAGRVEGGAGEAQFVVERALGDTSSRGSRLQMTRTFLRLRRRLAPHLERECARRGQPVPRIRRPPAEPIPEQRSSAR